MMNNSDDRVIRGVVIDPGHQSTNKPNVNRTSCSK